DAGFEITDAIKPFLYLDGASTYNNYPFSLPSSRTMKKTLCFRPCASAKQDMVDDQIKKLIAEEVSNFIVVDGGDVSALAFVDAVSRAYGFHFFGSYDPTFGQIKTVFEAWHSKARGEQALRCSHLDFALLNIRDDATRDQALTGIIDLINDPVCSGLETLSLRWMGLKDSHLTRIKDALLKKNRSLKRLILSFNDLSDACMAKGSSIASLIGATEMLPQLSYIDLKGNTIRDPKNWGLNQDINKIRAFKANRSHGHCAALTHLMLNFNSMPESLLAFAQGAIPGQLTHFQPFEHFSISDAVALKTGEGALNFKSTWVVSQGGYDLLADHMVRMFHESARALTVIDLRNARLEHEDLYTFLQHVPHPEQVRELYLAGSLKLGLSLNTHIHDKIAELLEKFTGLEFLDLSGNSLSHVALSYGMLSSTLKGFSFAGNALSGARMDAASTTNDFLYMLDASLDGEQSNLSYLNLSDQSLGLGYQAQEVLIINILTKGMRDHSALQMAILSKNQLRFDVQGDGEWSWINLLSLGRRTNPFLLLDITDNGVDAAHMGALVAAYKAKISKMPHAHWPVLRINCRLETGLYSEPLMVSNDKGFRALAEFYRTKRKPWDQHWGTDAERARVCNRLAHIHAKGYSHMVRPISAKDEKYILEQSSQPIAVGSLKAYLQTTGQDNPFNGLIKDAKGNLIGALWFQHMLADLEDGFQGLGTPFTAGLDDVRMTFVRSTYAPFTGGDFYHGVLLESAAHASVKMLVQCGIGEIFKDPKPQIMDHVEKEFKALEALRTQIMGMIEKLEPQKTVYYQVQKRGSELRQFIMDKAKEHGWAWNDWSDVQLLKTYGSQCREYVVIVRSIQNTLKNVAQSEAINFIENYNNLVAYSAQRGNWGINGTDFKYMIYGGYAPGVLETSFNDIFQSEIKELADLNSRYEEKRNQPFLSIFHACPKAIKQVTIITTPSDALAPYIPPTNIRKNECAHQ
ncbi:MAG: hypothetical protein Q8K36_07175, partial [Alphaproteobacteria bacterium]|nr:hypothetical protein [Alphaproteobacteria bacterium]